LKFGSSQLQNSKYIYTFNSENSCSGLNDYSEQLEKFKRCIFGLNEANDIIRKFLSESELKQLEINLEKNDCQFFLKKVLLTDDLNTKTKMFEIIKNQFSGNVIKETWNNFLDCQEMTVSQYQQMDELLTSEFGDEIGIVKNTTLFIWDDGTEETRTEKEKILPLCLQNNVD